MWGGVESSAPLGYNTFFDGSPQLKPYEAGEFWHIEFGGVSK